MMRMLAARIAVFLFTIHPIHVEAVTSIVGRADALCGVFYLLAVWSYTLAVRRMDRCCDDPSKDRSYARDHLLLLGRCYCPTALTRTHHSLIIPGMFS